MNHQLYRFSNFSVYSLSKKRKIKLNKYLKAIFFFRLKKRSSLFSFKRLNFAPIKRSSLYKRLIPELNLKKRFNFKIKNEKPKKNYLILSSVFGSIFENVKLNVKRKTKLKKFKKIDKKTSLVFLNLQPFELNVNFYLAKLRKTIYKFPYIKKKKGSLFDRVVSLQVPTGKDTKYKHLKNRTLEDVNLKTSLNNFKFKYKFKINRFYSRILFILKHTSHLYKSLFETIKLRSLMLRKSPQVLKVKPVEKKIYKPFPKYRPIFNSVKFFREKKKIFEKFDLIVKKRLLTINNRLQGIAPSTKTRYKVNKSWRFINNVKYKKYLARKAYMGMRSKRLLDRKKNYKKDSKYKFTFYLRDIFRRKIFPKLKKNYKKKLLRFRMPIFKYNFNISSKVPPIRRTRKAIFRIERRLFRRRKRKNYKMKRFVLKMIIKKLKYRRLRRQDFKIRKKNKIKKKLKFLKPREVLPFSIKLKKLKYPLLKIIPLAVLKTLKQRSAYSTLSIKFKKLIKPKIDRSVFYYYFKKKFGSFVSSKQYNLTSCFFPEETVNFLLRKVELLKIKIYHLNSIRKVSVFNYFLKNYLKALLSIKNYIKKFGFFHFNKYNKLLNKLIKDIEIERIRRLPKVKTDFTEIFKLIPFVETKKIDYRKEYFKLRIRVLSLLKDNFRRFLLRESLKLKFKRNKLKLNFNFFVKLYNYLKKKKKKQIERAKQRRRLLIIKKYTYLVKLEKKNKRKFNKYIKPRQMKKFLKIKKILKRLSKKKRKVKKKTKKQKLIIRKRLGLEKKGQFSYICTTLRTPLRKRNDFWLQPEIVIDKFKSMFIKKGYSFKAENIVKKFELKIKFKRRLKRNLVWFLLKYRPSFGVKPIRKGKATEERPRYLNSRSSISSGQRLFIKAVKKRREKNLEDKLLNEMLGTIQRRSQTYKELMQKLKSTFKNRVLL